ncbi:helix-turn-helix domain-containing protein [Escherichia coli]|uniref:helix-turn-helix domain-containing protein n=1 Tax=Escherichia coli TaxID=562 RepID=UPI003D7FE308
MNGGGVSQKWFEFLNAGECIIAPMAERREKALGTDPWVIWPSRYHDPQTHEFIDRTQLMRSYTKPKK